MAKEKKIIQVLYIEDNEGHARLLKKRLEKDGVFHVDWIADPIEGLKEFKRKDCHYDVVVVDYNLYGKSGLEVIHWLKKGKNSPPVIMITASGNEEVAVTAIQQGADDYLVKDVESNYLLLIPHVIRNAISRHQAKEEKEKTDRELKQLNALLRAEQEATNSGILVVDLNRKIIRFNKRFLKIWDVPESIAKKGEEKILLSYIRDSLKNREAFMQLVEHLYQHPDEERTGDIIELKSGEILSRNTYPVRLENKKIIGRIWDYEDVTERMKAEEEIRKLSSAVENSASMVMITDTKGCIEYVNPQFNGTTGYSLSEIRGKNPRILKSGKQSEEHYIKLWETITAGKEWRGELCNRKKNGDLYWGLASISAIKNKDGKITHYVCVHEDITERKKQEERVKHMASHDVLTGLPNRRTFHDYLSVALANAKRNKRMMAVFFIDLDRFKTINDSLGHDVGDKVLIMATKTIKSLLRENDILSRMGGDEFILLLPEIKKADDAQLVAKNFLETFSENKKIDGHQIHIGLSIGVSLYPKDGETPEVLIKKADDALYKVKQSGRNNFHLYSDSQ